MPSDDLGRDLGTLAEYGERTGRLAPAAAVRARADRRRRSRQVASGALAFLVVGGVGVGIALSRQTHRAAPPATHPSTIMAAPTTTRPTSPPRSSPPSTPPSSSRSSPPSSSTTSKPASASVFSGEREVLLLPENSEATVAVDENERAALSEDFGDRALFVLKKVSGDRYWIQTARLRVGGEASCLEAAATSGEAVPVTAAACDAAQKRQLWRFRKVGETDGKPKYTIRTGTDIYLVQDPDGQLADGGTGIVAIGIGEGTPDIDTPFLLPDRGKASLPALD
ncbi:hypothetical protein AB0J80_23645 [Actinoplanes sp. NPDC049548]|uniref:hypothetical protein n=1 Tax=Actinoplanes sp. NPDC049548 TaxID=3155152 RepID=UPI003415B6DF